MNETLDRDRTCERIRSMCAKREITVDLIVKEMNVSRQTVYSWFSGRKLPTIDHLVEIASLLNITIDDLIVRKTYISGG